MKLTVLALTVAFAASTGTVADAQTTAQRPERPYRGLFGGGAGDWQQSLTATVSIGGGYDDNVLAGSRGAGSNAGSPTTNPLRAQSGNYGYGFAGIAYGLNRPRATFGASAAATSRYYPRLVDDLLPSYRGGATLALQVRENTQLTASQTMSDRPYNLLELFPLPIESSLASAEAADEDFAIAGTHYVTHASAVGIAQRLGQRASLGFDYGYRLSHRSASSGNVVAHQAGSAFVLALTRGLGMRLGYGYRQSHNSDGTAEHRSEAEAHNLIAGIDYNRRLSVSRRTTVAFSTGSSAVTHSQQTVYRVAGNAGLTREIGRTWSASIAYDRNAKFVEAFDDPIVYDAATASVEGLISRRVQFQSAVRAAFGHVGLSKGRPYDTYSGVVGLNVAISRYLAAGTSYLYHRYQFGGDTALPRGVARQMDRQGLRAYISLWAPLFYRTRTPDATR